MLTFTAAEQVPSDFGRTAVTIGKFDGVHTGHRAVLSRLIEIARQRGLRSAVVTFDRNPLRLLAPERCPESLVSTAQKLELLASTGVDATLMLTFDRERSQQSAEDFVVTVLVRALAARMVLVGSDFRFGSRGLGTTELLQRLGAEHGFEVVSIDDVVNGGRRASSTWIRELLTQGRVREAAALLGTLPGIRSVVAHGQQRGRTLGYPTANLDPAAMEGFIPADGVYAAWMTVDGSRYPAAVSIGNNPTFDGVPEKQVEAHAIDASLDIYGRPVALEFVEYVRGMRRFGGSEELAAQMRSDEDRIRELLGVAPRA